MQIFALHSPRRRFIPVVLFLLSMLVCIERYHTFDEPPERDVACYAVVAHEILAGRALYYDIFDQKPPAIYLSYAAAELIGGYRLSSIALMGLIVALITLFGVFLAGAATPGGSAYGLLAAALWALMCSDLRLEANEANTEIFMNAALIWAFALLVRAENRLLNWRETGVLGLLAALATFYKPISVAIPGAWLLAHVAFPPGGPSARRGALVNALGVAGIIGAAWLLLAVFYVAQGQFAAFYYAMVTYNRGYAGGPQRNLVLGLRPHNLLARPVLPLCPLIAGALLLGGARARLPLDRRWILFLAYCLGVFAAVALPGRFYPHYYQFWLPVAACGFGWSIDTIRQWRPPQTARYASVVATMVGLCYAGYEAYYFRLSAVEWAQQKYGAGFVQAERLALALHRVLLPGETIYEATVEPEFYFFTRRRLVSGIFYSEPMWNTPLADASIRRVLNDLNHRPPDVVVMTEGADQYAGRVEKLGYCVPPPIMQWINQHYVRVPTWCVANYYVVFAHRGSPTEGRLLRTDLPQGLQ